jgi:hypothetical protein
MSLGSIVTDFATFREAALRVNLKGRATRAAQLVSRITPTATTLRD